MVDSRARVIRAALSFLSLEPSERELQRLHRGFDNWREIGDFVAATVEVPANATKSSRPPF